MLLKKLRRLTRRMGWRSQNPRMGEGPTRCGDLERVRSLAAQGETDLATIVAIRALARSERDHRADLLNDLSVLRFDEPDRVGAVACARAALGLEPSHALAGKNLRLMRSQIGGEPATTSADGLRPTGAATLNRWVTDALSAADTAIGLAGKSVLEIGGSVPSVAVREFGVRSWIACDLMPEEPDSSGYRTIPCDAAAIPLEGESVDCVFSVCAFEHFADVPGVLAEVRRLLRPGGRLYTHFGPIWSSALGSHVWIRDGERTALTFNDRAVPKWGHLLLEEHELLAFLTITRGEDMARRVVDYAWRSDYVNRMFEGDFQRFVDASELRVELYEGWGRETTPHPLLAEELRRSWPNGGNFALDGLRIQLAK